MIGAGLVRNFVGQINTIKAAVLAALAGPTGAGMVGEADGGTVQDKLTAHDGQLSNQSSMLAGSGGAGLVGFVQAGAGAVPRDLQAKDRERVTPDDFGAVGDGATDDSVALGSANAASDSLTGGGSGKVYLAGALSLAGAARLSFIKLLGAAGIGAFLTTAANAARVRLVGVDIEATAGTAFNHAGASCLDVAVIGSRIKGDSYAVLSNSSASGSDGLRVIGNDIESYKADGIEFNNPNEDVFNLSAIANAIYCGAGSASAASGFGVGVAGTQGHIAALNHVRRARNTAFHYEAGQTRGVCLGNTVQMALQAGVTIQAPAAGTGTPTGVIVAANHIEHSGSTADGYSGVWTISDANGAVEANILSDNYVRGFQYGYRLDGSFPQAGSNNVAHDCDTVVKCGAGSAMGTFYGRGTITTLAEVAGQGIVGKVVYSAVPTNILKRAGAGGPGAVLKGWLVRVPFAHPGGGATQAFDLVPAGTRFVGRITVLHASGVTGAFYTAQVKWDGAALTITDALPKHYGTLSNTSFTVANGKLQLSFASTSAYAATAKVDFDGIWYQD